MVVIATNVVFSGLRSNRGASYTVLSQLADGNIKFAVSTALIFEYEDVLKRNISKIPYNEIEIEEFLDSIASLANRHASHFLWRPFLKDSKDDMVLELAVVSGAKNILTYNLKDFKGIEKFGLVAMKPIEYVRKEKML